MRKLRDIRNSLAITEPLLSPIFQFAALAIRPRIPLIAALMALCLSASCNRPLTKELPEPSQTSVSSTSTEEAERLKPTATGPAEQATPESPRTCQEKGQIRTDTVEDPRLFRPLPYRIYLPPCFDRQGETRYPTVYLLHGLGRTDSQWDDLGVDQAADRLMGLGRGSDFLIVMPWERTGIELESALVDILLPHIENEYNAAPDRQSRAIGGISRGAGWALRIGLKHPDLFRAIGLHSPAVLSPDFFNMPDWVDSISVGYQPQIWIDIGERDTLLEATLELRSRLDELGVSYRWHLNEGYHEDRYWMAHLTEYLEWYSDVLSSAPSSQEIR